MTRWQLVREAWLSWLLLGVCLGMLGFELWWAVSSPWQLVGAAWSAALAIVALRLIRRQHRWVAARAERTAAHRRARVALVATLTEAGMPPAVAVQVAELLETERYPQAARLVLTYLPQD